MLYFMRIKLKYYEEFVKILQRLSFSEVFTATANN